MKNKKGMEMAIRTIVIIAFSLSVLLVISIYFSGSFKKTSRGVKSAGIAANDTVSRGETEEGIIKAGKIWAVVEARWDCNKVAQRDKCTPAYSSSRPGDDDTDAWMWKRTKGTIGAQYLCGTLTASDAGCDDAQHDFKCFGGTTCKKYTYMGGAYAQSAAYCTCTKK